MCGRSGSGGRFGCQGLVAPVQFVVLDIFAIIDVTLTGDEVERSFEDTPAGAVERCEAILTDDHIAVVCTFAQCAVEGSNGVVHLMRISNPGVARIDVHFRIGHHQRCAVTEVHRSILGSLYLIHLVVHGNLLEVADKAVLLIVDDQAVLRSGFIDGAAQFGRIFELEGLFCHIVHNLGIVDGGRDREPVPTFIEFILNRYVGTNGSTRHDVAIVLQLHRPLTEVFTAEVPLLTSVIGLHSGCHGTPSFIRVVVEYQLEQ